ncbi:MAG: energy transducer TonB [Bacteroidales bacterium]|nr:energy transducer TonB [Bacteroidales bacterium]
MAKGKQTCKILKEIRKQIAAENDIEFITSECTHKGDCKGTCPKCEAEVRYLERELEKRQRMGKAAVFAGMSLGTLFAATSCNTSTPVQQPLEGEPYIPDTTEMSNQKDTIPDDAYLLEGDVLAPVTDTTMKEEKKTSCKKDEPLAIVGDIEEVDWATEEGVTEGVIVPETGEIEDPEKEVYQIVEQMPKFPGGEVKLMEYVSNSIQYPKEAKENGVQGIVYVSFIVEPDGSVTIVKVLRGIGHGCDEEALRVVESMPKWNPGMHGGEPVRVSYQIPIWFKLEDSQE